VCFRGFFKSSAVLVILVHKPCVFLVHKPCLSNVAEKFPKFFFWNRDPRVPISVIFQFFIFFYLRVDMCACAGIKRAGAGVERGTVRVRKRAGAGIERGTVRVRV